MTSTPTTRALAAATVAAPILLLASTVAYITNGEGMNDGEAGGAIQVWAFVAFTLAVVGLARRLEDAAPRAAAAITVLGVAGAASGVGYAIDSIQAALVSGESLQEMDSAAAQLSLPVPGLIFPITLVALGILLARTGAAARVPSLLLVAGAVLFPASRIPDVEALAVAADVVLVLALVPLGWAAWERARLTSATPVTA